MIIGEEILQEIDQTLDRLVENAKAMEKASEKRLTSYERGLFQKTQESLLAHLIQTDHKLAERRETLKHFSSQAQKFPIQKKWIHLHRMQGRNFENLSKKMGVFSLQRVKRKKLSKMKKVP